MLTTNNPVLIIGAGLSGLSAGYHLKEKCLLLEKESAPGGMASSERVASFTFDKTGHLLHFQTRYVKDLLDCPSNSFKLAKHRRSSWVFSKNTYTRYPFQVNTYKLPSYVINDCVANIEKAQRKPKQKTPPSDFKNWILSNFGEGVAKHFMFPYNRKLWKTPLREMSTEWADKLIPKTELKQAIKGARADYRRNFGYNKIFYYPEQGGIQAREELFTKKLKKQIRCNNRVVNINLKNKTATTEDGKSVNFDTIVSTMPLPELIEIVTGLPKEIKEMRKQLKWVSVFNYNLGVTGDVLPNKHWVYFPEKKYVFYRVGVASNFSKHAAPSRHSSLYTEVSYTTTKPLQHSRRKLKEHIIEDLHKTGLLTNENSIVAEKSYDLEYAYPLPTKHNPAKQIKSFLKKHGIHSIGRYGGWEYMPMEECILQGRATAGIINRGKS